MFGGLDRVTSSGVKKKGTTKPRSSTTKKNTKTTTNRKGKSNTGDNGFMGTEVAIIASFAVSVLLFLSNFGLCGSAGDALRKIMLGTFGSIGYIAPILLFAGTCFYLSNRGD